jgi:acetate kinase
MRVLVVNAGSSSLKLRLLKDDTLEQRADLPAAPGGFDTAELARLVRSWAVPDAVGHRIVHGGVAFRGPAIVTAAVRGQLEALTDLAPLHQPKSLAALDAVTAVLPNVVAVASFDTAFHSTLPDAAATYAVPREWRERYAIRRYGFHGLSHAYSSRRVAEMLDRPIGTLRVVTCHLGAGASLAAVVGGRSVDTTMGFTPLDGLVMATRSGSIDPGLVLWLEEHAKLSPLEIATALEERSGMMALAGTGDMRQIEAAAMRREPDAVLAIEVYIHRLVGSVASMCAAAGGLDALAFTGGVGENSVLVRRITESRLRFLGVAINDVESDAVDRDISTADATVRTFVVAAREDLEIAREVRVLLAASAGIGNL